MALEAHQLEAITNANQLDYWIAVNKATTKELLLQAIDIITCNGYVKIAGSKALYDKDQLIQLAELVLSGANPALMTRAYGLRQQCLLILQLQGKLITA